MQTYIPERSEILRASQKDDEFINEFQQRVSELVKRIGNDALWIKFYKYFEPSSRLIYYCFTSIKGKKIPLNLLKLSMFKAFKR